LKPTDGEDNKLKSYMDGMDGSKEDSILIRITAISGRRVEEQEGK